MGRRKRERKGTCIGDDDDLGDDIEPSFRPYFAT
jgi:hypothetical protein